MGKEALMSRNALAGTGRKSAPVLKPLSNHRSLPIRVSREVCLLGSHARVHLPLHSAMVSRTHAMIVIDGAETYVRDLASRNGVYVNGHVVRESRLRHGDLLCVGPYAFWWCATPLPSPRPRHLNESCPDCATLFPAGRKAPCRMESHTFLIGHRPECDLALDGTMVDAAHAVVYRRAGRFFVRDLNSKSGTFINSRRSREAELRRGDEIRIGLTLIGFEPPEPAGQSAEPSGSGASGGEQVAGLGALMNSDRLNGSSDLSQRSCLTIEQLLGAPPTRITQWERPPNRTPVMDFTVPNPVALDLA